MLNLMSTLTPEAIGKALDGLPPPATETMERTVDVPGVGRVRFHYQRHVHRHAPTTRRFWVMVAAELENTAGYHP